MLVYYYPTCITIYLVCNTYGAGLLLCIDILFILYRNVIVFLLFVIATLVYLRFICIVCVSLFFYYPLFAEGVIVWGRSARQACTSYIHIQSNIYGGAPIV